MIKTDYQKKVKTVLKHGKKYFSPTLRKIHFRVSCSFLASFSLSQTSTTDPIQQKTSAVVEMGPKVRGVEICSKQVKEKKREQKKCREFREYLIYFTEIQAQKNYSIFF
jgi:hypothetical protein